MKSSEAPTQLVVDRLMTDAPYILLLALCFLAPTSGRAQSLTNYSADKQRLELELDWLADSQPLYHFDSTPITETTSVSLRVTHFNHLNYTLDITITEDTVPGYGRLAALWTDALSVGALVSGIPTGAEDDFSARLYDWLVEIEAARDDLSETLAAYRTVGLSDQQIRQLVFAAERFDQSIRERLVIARRRVRAAASTLAEAQVAGVYEEEYKTVVAAIDQFVRLTQQTATGSIYIVGRRSPGIDVTVHLAPRPRDVAGPSAGEKRISYFVRSSLPIRLHAGVAVAWLEQATFEKVRALAGEDLFAQTQSAEAGSDLLAFLSYRLASLDERAPVEIYGTAGVSVVDPAETLFLGLSLGVGRVMLTAGASTTVVEQGDNELLLDVAEELGVRHAFATLTSLRDWGPLVSLSVSVF